MYRHHEEPVGEAKIRVVGVGGGGSNAVNRMIAEQLAGVESFYTAGHMEWPHLLDNALKAHHLYKRDVNYVVNGDEVAQILRQAAADNPAHQSVIIRADRRVQLDSAVFVMNACNQAGIFDYTLTTSGEEN